MTIRCDGCRYWRPRDDDDPDMVRAIDNLGQRKKAVELWEAVRFARDYDGKIRYIAMPEHADQMLFCKDGEEYSASMWTRPAFFCAHHEPVTPMETRT